MRVSTRFIAAVASSALLGSGAASAFVRGESNWNPSSLPISYSINLSTAPSRTVTSGGRSVSEIGRTGAQTIVEAGFASWAGPTCTTWRATDAGDTTRTANTNDGHNTILWISQNWPAELGDVRSTIGVTTPVWQQGGYFIDADIQFNAVQFLWDMAGQGNTSTGMGFVDAQSIATHEEGHFLGLDHPPVPDAIMYASYSGGIKRDLRQDDINGVCAIYPSGGAVPDAGTVHPMDAGTTTPTGGAIGSACNGNSDCQSRQCVVLQDQSGNSSPAFCTGACDDDCGCPAGYACDPNYGLCLPGANTCSAPVDAGTPAAGMGTTGDPCTSGAECSSGVCAHATGVAGFCTRLCTDDCTCPGGFHCFATTTAGTNVCGPGTNTCATTPSDAGVTGVDASPNVVRDGAQGSDSSSVTPGQDGNSNSPDAGGEPAGQVEGRACGCSTPGNSSGSTSRWVAFMGVCALVAGARRRRTRKNNR